MRDGSLLVKRGDANCWLQSANTRRKNGLMKNRRTLVLLGVLVPVVAAVLLTTTMAIVTADAGPHQSSLRSTACESAPLPPSNVAVNTVLDAQNGVLEYSFLDPASGKNFVARIDYRVCRRPELQPLMSHVLAVEAKLRRDTCASVRQTLAAGATHHRGQEIDREAGARLLATEC